jgi:hypothetical protein
MKSANSTIPPGAGQSWDSSLRLLNAAEHSQIPPVVAGFDGFVDTILHVVSERRSPTEYTRLLTLQEFAQRVLAASGGHNMNIEMVTRLTKIGGNGPPDVSFEKQRVSNAWAALLKLLKTKSRSKTELLKGQQRKTACPPGGSGRPIGRRKSHKN